MPRKCCASDSFVLGFLYFDVNLLMNRGVWVCWQPAVGSGTAGALGGGGVGVAKQSSAGRRASSRQLVKK